MEFPQRETGRWVETLLNGKGLLLHSAKPRGSGPVLKVRQPGEAGTGHHVRGKGDGAEGGRGHLLQPALLAFFQRGICEKKQLEVLAPGEVTVLAGDQEAELKIVPVVHQAFQIAAGERLHQKAGIRVQTGKEGAGLRVPQAVCDAGPDSLQDFGTGRVQSLNGVMAGGDCVVVKRGGHAGGRNEEIFGKSAGDGKMFLRKGGEGQQLPAAKVSFFDY